jgi:hypothetical protein
MTATKKILIAHESIAHHQKTAPTNRRAIAECEDPKRKPPMATLTRSSRRAEALHPRSSSNANTRLIATSTRGGAVHAPGILKSPPAPRPQKRPLELSDGEYEELRKKTRITVEIISRSTIPIPKPPTAAPPALAVVGPSPQIQHHKPPAVDARPPPQAVPPAVQTVTATSTSAPGQLDKARVAGPSGLTKHQKKVINGIRHELDRLRPNAEDTKHGGRKLRSQEGTRFKSELSAYFPEYDEVIGNDPKEQRTQFDHF